MCLLKPGEWNGGPHTPWEASNPQPASTQVCRNCGQLKLSCSKPCRCWCPGWARRKQWGQLLCRSRSRHIRPPLSFRRGTSTWHCRVQIWEPSRGCPRPPSSKALLFPPERKSKAYAWRLQCQTLQDCFSKVWRAHLSRAAFPQTREVWWNQ